MPKLEDREISDPLMQLGQCFGLVRDEVLSRAPSLQQLKLPLAKPPPALAEHPAEGRLAARRWAEEDDQTVSFAAHTTSMALLRRGEPGPIGSYALVDRHCRSGVADLAGLQRMPQRLDGSGALASRHQGRDRLHQPHDCEEFTLRDVMNDCLVAISLEDVERSRLHQIDAEPAESFAETEPRRRLVFGHDTAERAHPRRVEVTRSHSDRAVGGLPRTGGTTQCGASTSGNHPGRPNARTRRR